MSDPPRRFARCAECATAIAPGSERCLECGAGARGLATLARWIGAGGQRGPLCWRAQQARLEAQLSAAATRRAQLVEHQGALLVHQRAARESAAPAAHLAAAQGAVDAALRNLARELARYKTLRHDVEVDRLDNALAAARAEPEGALAAPWPVALAAGDLPPGDEINDVAFSRADDLVALAFAGGTVGLFELGTGALRRTLRPAGYATALAFAGPRALAVASVDADTTRIELVDTGDGAARAIASDLAVITRLAGGERGHWLVSAGLRDARERIPAWQLLSLRHGRAVGQGVGTAAVSPRCAAAFGPREAWVALPDAAGVEWLGLDPVRPPARSAAPEGRRVSALSAEPSGRFVLCVTSAGLEVWDVASASLLGVLRPPAETPCGVAAFAHRGGSVVALSRDGQQVLVFPGPALRASAPREPRAVQSFALAHAVAKPAVTRIDARGRWLALAGDARVALFCVDLLPCERAALACLERLERLADERAELVEAPEFEPTLRRACALTRRALALAGAGHGAPAEQDGSAGRTPDERLGFVLARTVAALSALRRAGNGDADPQQALYEDLAGALLAPVVERAHVLVEAQLKGLASETERGCGERLAVLSALAPALSALRARFESLPDWLRAPGSAAAVSAALGELIARLPELSGVVAAARAMAAVGRADPIRGQALADELAHQRAVLRAECASPDEGDDDAALHVSARAQDVLAARDRALAAIGDEADRIVHATGALDELTRVR